MKKTSITIGLLYNFLKILILPILILSLGSLWSCKEQEFRSVKTKKLNFNIVLESINTDASCYKDELGDSLQNYMSTELYILRAYEIPENKTIDTATLLNNPKEIAKEEGKNTEFSKYILLTPIDILIGQMNLRVKKVDKKQMTLWGLYKRSALNFEDPLLVTMNIIESGSTNIDVIFSISSTVAFKLMTIDEQYTLTFKEFAYYQNVVDTLVREERPLQDILDPGKIACWEFQLEALVEAMIQYQIHGVLTSPEIQEELDENVDNLGTVLSEMYAKEDAEKTISTLQGVVKDGEEKTIREEMEEAPVISKRVEVSRTLTITYPDPSLYNLYENFSITPTVEGETPNKFTIEPSLPEGLSLDESTGEISGIPTESKEVEEYTIEVSNLLVTITTTLNLGGASELIYSSGSLICKINRPCNNTPDINGETPSDLSIDPELPPGLEFDPTTGEISGIVTGTFTSTDYTITASYPNGDTSSTLMTLIGLATDASYGEETVEYKINESFTLNPLIVGDIPSGYSIDADGPQLPAGLSIDETTGEITGTPTEPIAMTDYTVILTFEDGTTSKTTVSLGVALPEVTYSDDIVYYKKSLSFSIFPTIVGETPTPLSISPALPTGLDFNRQTGEISGVPSATADRTDYTISFSYYGNDGTATVTLDGILPVLGFQVTSQSLTEQDLDVSVSVTMSKTYSRNNSLAVNYTIEGNGDTDDSDLADGSFNIAAGELEGVIDFMILDDNIYEDSVTVVVTMTAPGTTDFFEIDENAPSHTLTIADDPSDSPGVGFTYNPSRNIAESIGSDNIAIFISKQSVFETVVNYTVSTGGASNPEDHNLSNGAITIAAMSWSASIPFTIVDDNVFEGTGESVSLEITNVDDDRAGVDLASKDLTLNISENLSDLKVEFQDIAGGNIHEGTTSTITVTLSALKGGNPISVSASSDITVPITLSGYAKEVASGDFTQDINPDASSIVISAGNSSGTLDINILDNSVTEVEESMQVDLLTPNTLATLGTKTTYNATILGERTCTSSGATTWPAEETYYCDPVLTVATNGSITLSANAEVITDELDLSGGFINNGILTVNSTVTLRNSGAYTHESTATLNSAGANLIVTASPTITLDTDYGSCNPDLDVTDCSQWNVFKEATGASIPSFTNVTINSGAALTHVSPPLTYNPPHTYSLILEATGTFDVQGTISAISSGYPGSGLGAGGESEGGSGGGGHGGAGGDGAIEIGGGTYDNSQQPVELGSGGGDIGNDLGFGGGAIHIIANTLKVRGPISARGGYTDHNGSGGGAGGSIWIEATTLEGTADIEANGGNAESASAGAGGGGLIAIYTCTDNHTGSVTALAGDSSDFPGNDGVTYTATLGSCP